MYIEQKNYLKEELTGQEKNYLKKTIISARNRYLEKFNPNEIRLKDDMEDCSEYGYDEVIPDASMFEKLFSDKKLSNTFSKRE